MADVGVTTSTSPSPHPGKATPNDKDVVISLKANGAPNGPSLDKAEKEKAKKKDKKDKKEKERVERDAKDKEGNGEEKDENEPPTAPQGSKSGKSTPIPDASTIHASNSPENVLRSPATESTGIRTPTGRKPARNPWTLFMRMEVTASESELKEFFGEAQSGVSVCHIRDLLILIVRSDYSH